MKRLRVVATPRAAPHGRGPAGEGPAEEREGPVASASAAEGGLVEQLEATWDEACRTPDTPRAARHMRHGCGSRAGARGQETSSEVREERRRVESEVPDARLRAFHDAARRAFEEYRDSEFPLE